MKEEAFENFNDFIKDLVYTDYHGEITVKFHQGIISVAEKTDKIKFDIQNYRVYKNRINNNLT